MTESAPHSALWIAHVHVTDADAYGRYAAEATKAIAAHGGVFLTRSGAYVQLEGHDRARNVVARFPSLAAAEATGARFAMPGTIYNFDPEKVPVVHPDSPQHPKTAKGRIRAEMERRIAASPARTLILRPGDPIPDDVPLPMVVKAASSSAFHAVEFDGKRKVEFFDSLAQLTGSFVGERYCQDLLRQHFMLVE